MKQLVNALRNTGSLLLQRLVAALQTIPTVKDWVVAIGLLLIFTLIYLPIGLKLGFLSFGFPSSWQTVIGVSAASFFMPGVLEELMFRGLLIPRTTETTILRQRWFWVVLSWLLFIAYHLYPFTPAFFKGIAFLSGAGLLGIACTLSYLQSQSIWTAVFIHWIIVVVWLLLFGGLAKFG